MLVMTLRRWRATATTIRTEVAGLGDLPRAARHRLQELEEESSFSGPPAISRRLRDLGPERHVLDAHRSESDLRNLLAHRIDDIRTTDSPRMRLHSAASTYRGELGFAAVDGLRPFAAPCARRLSIRL